MSCPDPICKLVTCVVTDDLPAYLGTFSLQSGLVFENGTIVVPNPAYPSGFYTAAPGTIIIPVPPNAGDPTLALPATVSYQGCLTTVSATIPIGSTTAQIQAIVAVLMQEIAAQLAICNQPPSPQPSSIFWNDEAESICSQGDDVKVNGSLPPGVTLIGTTLTLPAGVFSSTVSQADADQQAVNFLNNLFGTVVLCGWWNQAESTSC